MIEIEGSIKNNSLNDNLIIPISADNIINHSAIRDIITSNNLPARVEFELDNTFKLIYLSTLIIVFYNLKNVQNVKLTAEAYFNAVFVIKQFCINHQIKQFLTFRLEGLTSLTC